MSPRVHPLQFTKLNISSAGRYGHIMEPIVDHPYYPTGEDRFAVEEKQGRIAMIQDRLEEFHPDDYLLILGDPIHIGLVFMELGSRLRAAGQDHLKVLRWDGMLGRYLEMEVELFTGVEAL